MFIGVLFSTSSCTSNQEKNTVIKIYGKTTIGRVYKRYSSRDKKTRERNYYFHFDFFVGDSLVSNTSYRATEEEYQEAIVGMKYQVKYLEKSPSLNSIIFIDKPILAEFINIKQERVKISKLYEQLESMSWYYNCRERKGAEELFYFIYVSKVPNGTILTWRNDSLVITTTRSVEYNERLEEYNKYIVHNEDFINCEEHFLINSLTGQFIDTLDYFKPDYNTSKLLSSRYSEDRDTIRIGTNLVSRYIIFDDYKGFKINYEHWDPEWRCPSEDRIAIHKDTTSLKYYNVPRGASDFIIENNNIIILTLYPEDNRGIHLLKIPVDSLIQGL